MAFAIVAKLPVSKQELFHNQTKLADKIVSDLSRSRVESRFHTLFLQSDHYRKFYEEKAGRIHSIEDGLNIYDSTKAGAIRVCDCPIRELFFDNYPI